MSLSVRPYSRHLVDCIKAMAQLQAKLMWIRGLWELFAMVGGGAERKSVEEWSRLHSPIPHFLSLLNSFCLFFHLLSGLVKPTGWTGGRGMASGGIRMREQGKKGGDRWNEIKTSSRVSCNERNVSVESLEEERKQRVIQCQVKTKGMEFPLGNPYLFVFLERWRGGLCYLGVLVFSCILNFMIICMNIVLCDKDTILICSETSVNMSVWIKFSFIKHGKNTF